MTTGWDAVPALTEWTVHEITGQACPCCHCLYSLAREKVTGPDGRHTCRPCAVLLGVATEAEAAR
ncbi:hypothetical protein QT196_14505 [Streptomyces sp. P9-2B-2]|uniref:hypothetical protein n=1 Tax=Streptomyces sp. P9-2B-2 TaxID=3057114 RepID=UPI0025B3A9CF|nr:hypothetical protein [Streptomyces sp. P9-2B-2]WJY38402.1 hypothetical protein QT196_14505 [Streptomyces sp. P9-2B-2]